MVSTVSVVAHNADKTENVYYDTTVTHRKNAPALVIVGRAIRKCRTMLRVDHPMLLAELVVFTGLVE